MLGINSMILKHFAVKKIAKKYQNLARKVPYQRPDKNVEDYVVLLKQVPVIDGID